MDDDAGTMSTIGALTRQDSDGQVPAVVDLPTAARLLGIGRATAYHLAAAGRFPCPVLRVGRQWRVPTVGLLAALGAPAATPHQPPPDGGGDGRGVDRGAAVDEWWGW